MYRPNTTAHNCMPKKETGRNVTVLSFFPPPPFLALYRCRNWGQVAAPAAENLLLQFPRGLQEHLKGQSGGVGDHATRRARSQKTSGAGVERAASTCGFGTCILSNGTSSVTGPEGQRQSDLVSPHAPRPPAHPHHGAYGRERWPLPEKWSGKASRRKWRLDPEAG